MAVKWRIIGLKETDGYTQMAIDQAIMQARIEGKVPNTLRFYIFDDKTITIGCNQKEKIEVPGCQIVRRITGGSAIFHKNDFTYSLIALEDDLPNKIVDSYKYIGQGILNGLKNLNISAYFGYEEIRNKERLCYLSQNPYDILVDGRKISGNAQARKNGVVLQHGTIIMDDDFFEMATYFNLDVKQIKAKVTSVKENLEVVPIILDVEKAFKKGFVDLFCNDGGIVIEGRLTEYEKKLVKRQKNGTQS